MNVHKRNTNNYGGTIIGRLDTSFMRYVSPLIALRCVPRRASPYSEIKRLHVVTCATRITEDDVSCGEEIFMRVTDNGLGETFEGQFAFQGTINDNDMSRLLVIAVRMNDEENRHREEQQWIPLFFIPSFISRRVIRRRSIFLISCKTAPFYRRRQPSNGTETFARSSTPGTWPVHAAVCR